MHDLRRLRILREVASHGSLAGAAEALGSTPQDVSLQVSVLEREAGARLVHRSRKGARLTEAGGALAHSTDAIFAELMRAEQRLGAMANASPDSLRISTFPTAGATVLPPALTAFKALHPGVELRVTEAEADDSVARLRRDEADLAIIFEYDEVPRPDWHGVERLDLFDDPVRLALSAAHPLAQEPVLSFRDLADESWLAGTPKDACSRLLKTVCRRAGFEPRIDVESNDYSVIQGLVAAGVGVAMMPTLALDVVREGVVIRSLGEDTPIRRVRSALCSDRAPSPSTEAMLAALGEASEKLARQGPMAEVS